MIISIGSEPKKIISILEEIEKMTMDGFEPTMGTHFLPADRLTQGQGRDWWILNVLATNGQIHLSSRAENRMSSKAAIEASDLTRTSGEFKAKQCLEIINDNGHVIGKGIVNYSSADLERIVGERESEIGEILGFDEIEKVIDGENVALVI